MLSAFHLPPQDSRYCPSLFLLAGYVQLINVTERDSLVAEILQGAVRISMDAEGVQEAL